MVDNAFDQAFLLQMFDGDTRQAPIDFQPFNENALTDKAPCRHFLHHTIIGWLIADDRVLGLILDLALRPLLLLSSFSARRWGWCFCLGLSNILVHTSNLDNSACIQHGPEDLLDVKPPARSIMRICKARLTMML